MNKGVDGRAVPQAGALLQDPSFGWKGSCCLSRDWTLLAPGMAEEMEKAKGPVPQS